MKVQGIEIPQVVIDEVLAELRKHTEEPFRGTDITPLVRDAMAVRSGLPAPAWKRWVNDAGPMRVADRLVQKLHKSGDIQPSTKRGEWLWVERANEDAT